MRTHILFAAKEVFLESGYERASMDAVAARAQTSKRSLYAYFKSKDMLFLRGAQARSRKLYLGVLRTPDSYAESRGGGCSLLRAVSPAHALGVAARRAPADSPSRKPSGFPKRTTYNDAMFTSTIKRLSDYLAENTNEVRAENTAEAENMLARAVFPRLMSALKA